MCTQTSWRRGIEPQRGTHIVFLAETEEPADLGRALGTKALRVDSVRKTRDILLALLDNGKGDNRQVHSDNAAADTLSLALSGAAGAVAAVALTQEQAHTSGVHDTLLHRETLLVVATGDLEDVALELVANRVARNLLAHAVVHEDAHLALIFDIDQLLRPVGRVADVQLHLDGWVVKTVPRVVVVVGVKRWSLAVECGNFA